MKKKLAIACVLLYNLCCFSQTLTIQTEAHKFNVDHNKAVVISQIKDIDTYTNLIAQYSEVELILDQEKYIFTTVPNQLTYTDSYSITDSETTTNYTLYFTALPLISISTENTIVDEPKVYADFYYADDSQILTSKIGIEIRGGISQLYPKKTYDLEFWEDELGDDTRDVSFGNLRSDDDWIIDALYNEPLRLRSYTANKLWLDIHTPTYLDEEPDAKSGADVNYVEVFLNGSYNGVYNLSEQVDKKQLELKSNKDDIRGELFKGVGRGASTFTALPNYDNTNELWGGYEVKYPKADEIIDWKNLYEFTNFVMNAPESDFKANIWDRFNRDNYINYFIFFNLIRAEDNTGKNIYLAKYTTDEPYFYVPWDLDGCFGTIWDGSNENITDDILTNGFMSRVIDLNPNNINEEISNRWFALRQDTLTYEALSQSISNKFNDLKSNNIYEREALVYPNYSFSEDDLLYTLNWLEDRLTFLDTYFENVLSTQDHVLNSITIYPNPAKHKLNISNYKEIQGQSFKIYNNIGQLSGEGIIENNYISVEYLQDGLYVLQIDNETFKFIKS
ncbi:CotH kinase family protein [uncultured Formosa sp.]|uniref:CotH kinase family protein n=1 Tax=uncultured Formosa sp. TaxID=255435 RepID=UPI0026228B05|nr:CotH kinase family protein [uncultured Formosa sp.]